MTDVDVFVVAGQSNAVGQGSSGGSPDLATDTAYEYKSNTDEIVTIDDPVGEDNSPRDRQASTGSMWPAFAQEYYDATGRIAVYVPYSVGGSEQADGTGRSDDLSWSAPGNLDTWAQEKLTEAINWLNSNGHNPTVWGVVWQQGERDARAIDDGDITKSDYKTAFDDHIGRWQAEFGSDFRFFVIQVGHETGGDTQGYIDVRDAQTEVTNERTYAHMVSDIQKDFPEDGKLSDSVHWNQTGLNDAGTEAGINTATVVQNATAGTPSVAARMVTSAGIVNTTNGIIQSATPDTTAPTISNFTVVESGADTTAPTISNFSVTESSGGGGVTASEADSKLTSRLYLSESSGPFADSVGTYDGTATGTTQVTGSWVDGAARDGNGSGDFITLDGSSDLDSLWGTNHAIAFSIQTTDTANSTVFGVSDDGMWYSISVGGNARTNRPATSGHVQITMREAASGNVFTAESNQPVDDGNPHRVVVNKVAENDVEFYIDQTDVGRTIDDAQGSIDTTGENAFDIPLFAFNDQSQDLTEEDFLNGVIDDFCIFNTDLTTTEAQSYSNPF